MALLYEKKRKKRDKRNKRILYAVIFVILVIIEVFIALFVRDAFVRPYVGDMLVVVVLYMAVRIIIPDKCRLLPLYIFLFAAAIEGLQYFHLVEMLGLGEYTFFRILIGSVFDSKDIVCYGVGCVFLGIFEWRMLTSNLKACSPETTAVGK